MGNKRRIRSAPPQDIEEQLRAAVVRQVRGKPGANASLAKFLGVSAVFVSEYMSGDRKSAGLHRSVMIMRWLGISLNDYLLQIVAPPENDLTPSLHDPEVAAMVQAMIDLKAAPQLRRAVLMSARAFVADLTSRGRTVERRMN